MKSHMCFILLLLLFAACGNENGKTKVQNLVGDTIHLENSKEYLQDTVIKKISVIILPCANGYGYEINLESFIANALEEDTTIKVLPFPYKALQNTVYLGIYDKKYCPPVIEKVNADYLIMSMLTGVDVAGSGGFISQQTGYKIKILNTKTFSQINSISASNPDDIKTSILTNANRLIQDIKTCN